MSEYIMFWLSKFIAEVLWGFIVLTSLFVGAFAYLVVMAIVDSYKKWRNKDVQIKKEDTNN